VQKSHPSLNVKVKGQGHPGQKKAKKIAELSTLTISCISALYAARSSRRHHGVTAGGDRVMAACGSGPQGRGHLPVLRQWENQKLYSFFSERELCYHLSVCRLSLTLVRPTQAVEIFGNISTAFCYLGHPLTSTENFTEIVQGESLRRGS